MLALPPKTGPYRGKFEGEDGAFIGRAVTDNRLKAFFP